MQPGTEVAGQHRLFCFALNEYSAGLAAITQGVCRLDGATVKGAYFFLLFFSAFLLAGRALGGEALALHQLEKFEGVAPSCGRTV